MDMTVVKACLRVGISRIPVIPHQMMVLTRRLVILIIVCQPQMNGECASP